MSIDRSSVPRFEVVYDGPPSTTLVAGFAEFGLAGLTAADYLVERLDLDEVGHVAVSGLPVTAPFSGGTPRHHTRLFSSPDRDLVVLVGELFVPPAVADLLARELVEWTAAEGIDECVLLSGVPLAHGPDAHRTFYIATEGYQERYFASAGPGAPDDDGDGDDADGHRPDVDGHDDTADDTAAAEEPNPDRDPQAMGNGYLSGLNGSLVARALDAPFEVCVLSTPVHSGGPDVDAALRLVETVDDIHDLAVDTDPLREFAAGLDRHYERLAEHVEDTRTREDVRYEDRMYM